jgi:hypothetical protein
MRVHTLPNFWIHASGDHAVATRYDVCLSAVMRHEHI